MTSNKYDAIHAWLRNTFPYLGTCEQCGASKRRTEYALVDPPHRRDRRAYKELCVSCHRRLDRSGSPGPFTGRHHSDETRKKISSSLTGQHRQPTFLGRHHTDDARRRIGDGVRAARKRKAAA